MANCDTFEIGNNLAERKPNWKLKRLHIAQKVEEDNEEIRMQIMRILWKVKWKRKCRTTPCTQNIENMIIKEKGEKWGFFKGKWEREMGKECGWRIKTTLWPENRRRRWWNKMQMMQNLLMMTWKENNVDGEVGQHHPKYREDVE